MPKIKAKDSEADSSSKRDKVAEDNDHTMGSGNETEEAPPSLGPAALGLHRVGTELPKPLPKNPLQVLNARGMPARIRKKNKFFFDDDIINDGRSLRSSLSPKKGLTKTPTASPAKSPRSAIKKPLRSASKKMKLEKEEKESIDDENEDDEEEEEEEDAENDDEDEDSDETEKIQSVQQKKSIKQVATTAVSERKQVESVAEKKIGQLIGLRLRNLLKLPKAHKWVSFEWFYSFIDKPLFHGENEFQSLVAEKFPQLKTQMLTRTEWWKIRTKLGKPRRFSDAFLELERDELARKRHKIRIIQSRKWVNTDFVYDLPNEIPLALPVGTKVTARLRKPQDGIFTGTVDAVNTLSATYRISFDRLGLGTHSIPDYEVLSNDFHETISLSSLTQDFRPKVLSNGSMLSSPSRVRQELNKSDPLLGQELYESQFKNPVVGQQQTIGGFDIRLLELIVRTKKTLAYKQSKLQRLRDLNNEAEMQRSYEDAFADDFQRRYSSILISMEKLNRDLQDYLAQLQGNSWHLSKEPHITAMLTPSYLRERCREMAEEAVQRNNQNTVQDETILGLITDLATIMLVASHLSSSENGHTLTVLKGCLEEVKGRLNTSNIEAFQHNVQLHMHHIQVGLGQLAIENGIEQNMVNEPDKRERNPFGEGTSSGTAAH